MTPMTLLFAAALSTAAAGDPCPISLQFASYTPPWRSQADDLAALQTQRRWTGVSYKERSGVLFIAAVIPGSPAEKAGVKVGDGLDAINGFKVRDRAHANAQFDKPDAATKVTLGIVRKEGAVDIEIERGLADPVFLGLVNAAETRECRDVSIVGLKDAQSKAIRAGAFDANKGFRCKDAHIQLEGKLDSGVFVVIRGGSRILLTMPGWTTKCVDVSEYDGAALTRDKLAGLLDGVSMKYVQDRHDNP